MQGEGFDVMKSGDARVALIGFPSVGKVLHRTVVIVILFNFINYLGTCYPLCPTHHFYCVLLCIVHSHHPMFICPPVSFVYCI